MIFYDHWPIEAGSASCRVSAVEVAVGQAVNIGGPSVDGPATLYCQGGGVAGWPPRLHTNTFV
jgi:hypothetical protein